MIVYVLRENYDHRLIDIFDNIDAAKKDAALDGDAPLTWTEYSGNHFIGKNQNGTNRYYIDQWEVR